MLGPVRADAFEYRDDFQVHVTDIVDEPPLNHDGLITDVVAALPDHMWAQRDFYRLTPDVRLRLSWDDFCWTVKHHRRYFFGDAAPDPDDPDTFTPAVLLDQIGQAILDAGLIRALEREEPIFRVRADDYGRTFSAASEIGTAPTESLKTSGRMAPAGIPIFGAFDSDTALTEARDANPRADSFTIGRFKLLRSRDLRAV
jgi:hypothetical protein